jgi:hypothetical protein
MTAHLSKLIKYTLSIHTFDLQVNYTSLKKKNLPLNIKNKDKHRVPFTILWTCNCKANKQIKGTPLAELLHESRETSSTAFY